MKQYVYSFEKLEAWKHSKNLTKTIYLMTQNFPKTEINGLTDQMRRASISISSNLAEGCGRKIGKDQARFYQFALSSSFELLNQTIIAWEINYINEDEYLKCRNLIEIISFQINSLSKYTLKNGLN
jgi:four helix bundle protein